MDITCNSCQSTFKLPDEKVPKGKVFSLSCPKCKNKISINPAASTAKGESPAAKPNMLFDEVASGSYDSAERPFDFIEEGAKTALICEADPVNREKIVAALRNLDYHVTHPASARDTLKQMRFHVFDIIVINETFDTPDPDHNNVLRYIERLPMSTRRDIFVALLTSRFRTSDNMAAFNKSVNIVINTGHVDEVEKVLKRGISDNDNFYRVFKESMVKTGRV
ncbi:MAG: zinc-ribbon domain-containing protein [Pseudomonadota bacterium]